MQHSPGSRTTRAPAVGGRWVLVVLLGFLVWPACGSENPSAFESFVQARNRAVATFCDCYWDDRFDEYDECVRVMRDDPGVAACRAEAFLARRDELEPEMACRARVTRRYEACLRRSSCSLLETGNCDSAASAELEECPRASESAWTSSVELAEACVVGLPSGCPDMGPATSITGAAVVSGSTVGAGSDLESECGGDAAPDVALLWTAPMSGTFSIDTKGSGYDTVLSVRTACDGEELACNDDEDASFLSKLILDVHAGQTVLIVVDGYGNLAGDFVLNIEPPLQSGP